MAQDRASRVKMMMDEEKANWAREEFEAMPPKILRQYVHYNGSATMEEAQLKIVKERGFNSADKALAREVFLRQGAKSTAAERPEDYARTHGGRNVFFPTTVELHTLGGEKKIRPNSPIPLPFGSSEKYKNSVAVAALVSQFVKNNSGKWETAINAQWLKTFADSFVAMETVELVSRKICQILTEDVVWKSYSTLDRNAVTGATAMVFVRAAMERLTKTEYQILNTKIVCDAFRTFSRSGQDFFQNMLDEDTPLVPEQLYEVWEPTDEAAEVLEGRYPNCFMYLGGCLPVPNVPPSQGTMESAKKSGDRVREVLGRDVSTSNLLAEMRDFSGLTDFFGKKIAFFLSSTLYCWKKGRHVDIQLESIGDALMLVSSLNYWREEINDRMKKQVKGCVFPNLTSESFRLLSPAVNTVIPQKIRSLFEENPRPTAVFIMWNAKVLPGVDEKGSKVDYDSESYDLLPIKAQNNDYIMSTAIFGAAPFPRDVQVEKKVDRSMVEARPWKHGPYVYKFSSAAHFRGVLSSFSDFHLVGEGFDKNPATQTFDVRGGMRLVDVPLLQIKTQKEWFIQVSGDCNKQIVAFFCPVVRYSPISNLARMSKNALILTATTVEKEDGSQYVGTPQAPKRMVNRRKIVAWAPKNGEGVRKGEEVRKEKPELRRLNPDPEDDELPTQNEESDEDVDDDSDGDDERDEKRRDAEGDEIDNIVIDEKTNVDGDVAMGAISTADI